MKSFITKISTLLLLIISATAANAQTKFGDNKATINGSSLFELESTNKGLLMPRISLTNTTTWGLATATPVNGMVVYNTNAAMAGTGIAPTLSGVVGMYYWDGAKWIGMSGQQKGQADSLYWALNGNTGTTPPTTVGTAAGTNNYWGTTDAKNLAVATTGTIRAIFDQNGSLYGGSGTYDVTLNPQQSLVWGVNNKDSADYTLMAGQTNFIAPTAAYGVAAGRANRISGQYSVVTGEGNIETSSIGHNVLSGNTNSITGNGYYSGINGYQSQISSTGHDNFISGEKDTISGGSNSAVFGLQNTASMDKNLVSGWNNKVSSDYNVVGGNLNTLVLHSGAGRNAVFGFSNIANTRGAVIGGESNKDSADYTIVTGENNTLSAASTHTAMFGGSNYSNGPGSLIAGALNRDSAGYSIITGDNNTLAPTSAESNLFGTQNRVYNNTQTANGSSLITIMGAANILTFDPTAYNPYGVSHATAILGQSNRVTNTPNSLITGFNDTAFASSTVVMGGQNNKVYGAASPAVFGGSNKDSAGYTLVAGFNNIIGTTGTYGAAIGQNNKVAHANSFALGTNAATTKANQLVANFTGGVVLAQLPVYATDAAADADATLPGGSLYKLTGSRAVFQKP